MPLNSYCQECGTPNKSAAKFCGECGEPFPGVTARAKTAPLTPPRQTSIQRRRIVQEHEQFEENDGDEIDDTPDDSQVPANLTGLEVDIEVRDNREKLSSLAFLPKVSSDLALNRPPAKVPKNKKDFEKNFMAEFRKEAGTRGRDEQK